MKEALLLATFVMLLALPPRAAAEQPLPSAEELLASVAARYASMQTYRDEGRMLVDVTGQVPFERRFVTSFDRRRGLKVEVFATDAAQELRDVMWDDLRCVRTYKRDRDKEYLTECRSPDDFGFDPEGVFPIQRVQTLIWERLLPGPKRSIADPSWVRVEEDRLQDGRLAYALLYDSRIPTGRKTWIDAASRQIVRYEERHQIGLRDKNIFQVLSVDYLVVEIDGPIPASSLRFRPPFYLAYRAQIAQIPFYAILLGIPLSVMVWLGHRHGRRGAATLLRAGALSSILSWTIVGGWSGHGVFALPLPAWLWVGVRLMYGSTREIVAIPPEWASPIATLCGYLVGALVGRATRHGTIRDAR